MIDERDASTHSGPPARDRGVIADIEKALTYLAELIQTRPEGEAYWPIFERLERERDVRISRQERLQSARAKERVTGRR